MVKLQNGRRASLNVRIARYALLRCGKSMMSKYARAVVFLSIGKLAIWRKSPGDVSGDTATRSVGKAEYVGAYWYSVSVNDNTAMRCPLQRQRRIDQPTRHRIKAHAKRRIFRYESDWRIAEFGPKIQARAGLSVDRVMGSLFHARFFGGRTAIVSSSRFNCDLVFASMAWYWGARPNGRAEGGPPHHQTGQTQKRGADASPSSSPPVDGSRLGVSYGRGVWKRRIQILSMAHVFGSSRYDLRLRLNPIIALVRVRRRFGRRGWRRFRLIIPYRAFAVRVGFGRSAVAPSPPYFSVVSIHVLVSGVRQIGGFVFTQSMAILMRRVRTFCAPVAKP